MRLTVKFNKSGNGYEENQMGEIDGYAHAYPTTFAIILISEGTGKQTDLHKTFLAMGMENEEITKRRLVQAPLSHFEIIE